MLLRLDAEKVFDRVDWKYLKQKLGKMHFYTVFINWISVLYSGPTSKVRVNGYSSKNYGL